MTTNAVEDLNAGIGDILRKSAKGAGGDPERPQERAGPAAVPLAPAGESAAADPGRLPRRIAGGFRGVGDDLDRRARDWRNMVRLLEQQRPQLETAEAARDSAYESFSGLVPEVQESGRQLKALLEATKSGDVSGDLSAQFNKSLNALDKLEGIAESLTTNLLWVRAAWEQYARTIIEAQRMREELKQG